MVPFEGLFRFFASEWRILCFGLLFQFVSSFGRTFYIALFGGEIQSDFDLTPGEFSYVYSAATLTAALLVPWLGRLVDDIDIKPYAILMICVLAVSAFGFAASWHVAVLFVALFGFRITGGTMMNHASVVTMARYFHRRRGIATAIISLGIAAGEAVLPLLAVVLMAAIGWRLTWAANGIFILLIAAPLLIWMLGPINTRARAREDPAGDVTVAPPVRSATRREAMSDPMFYALAPTIILPAPLITALFFHHATIAETKGWTLEWLAACFIGYAVATVVATMASGPLVDRYSARKVLPWTTVPMVFGLLFLAYGGPPMAALAYLIGVGLTTGGRYSLSAAIWAEIYGTRYLGSIRSMVHTVTVLLFGLSPAALGWLIDYGVAIDHVVYGFVILLVGSMIAASMAMARR